ncbi:unnamed protein product [Discosporangium mesarthrocarpum]
MSSETLPPRTALLIIDPQNDFHPGGSLAVSGSDADAERIAAVIDDHAEDIAEIFVTLDSHHRMDIAHPKFWKGADGSSPPPFTLITQEDLEAGRWLPVEEANLDHCKGYARKLKEGGRFTLCIWPEHCLIGTPGHAIYPGINRALQDWAVSKRKTVTYIHKGQSTLTEHYSCFRAEVMLEDDPSTGLNTGLIAELGIFERVLICGQALSHCVNFSTRDLAANWDPSRLGDLVLMRDGTSSVPGFEEAGEMFVKDMVDMGVTVTTCATALA